jgi:hypothetical protein
MNFARKFAVCVCLLVVARSAFAQVPANVGSASAAFGTGVTQARDAEAVLWNPALLGIQADPLIRDAVVGSFRVLGVHVRRAPSSAWLDSAGTYGFLGGGPGGGEGWRATGAPFGGGSAGGAIDVLWVASANERFGVALSSHARGDGEVRGAYSRGRRSLSTVATVAIARDLVRGGRGSVLRAGFGLKGRWTHLHGRTSAGDSAGGEVVVEDVARGVAGASVDGGLVLSPGRGVRVAATLSDVARITWAPKGGVLRRTVAWRSDGSLGESYRPQADSAEDAVAADDARRLYEETVPGSWLRVGVSGEGRLGLAAVAVEVQLRDGGLDGGEPRRRVSASYQLPLRVPVPLRLGLAAGEGGAAWSVGWISPHCGLPWSVAVGSERSRQGGSSLSLSASLGVRPRPACVHVR